MLLPVFSPVPDTSVTATDMRAGLGRAVASGDIVTVHIIARNTAGKIIVDTDKRGLPLQFEVSPDASGNWQGALLGMKEGGVRKVRVTTMNASGKKQGPVNSAMTVTVRLLKVESPS
ncbi:MAG: FKBP-type peptidyl-prolyl cis-trans isomerase [Armatimonadetes bacterium]|nr:FKBP-type peptidyl-prolyl cis-trans isomerase [Armatimonadota bacterium]